MIQEASTLSDSQLSFLRNSSRVTLHQDPLWMEAVSQAYPAWESRYLLMEQDGSLRLVMPAMEITQYGFRQIVSLPFGTYGGPVTEDDISKSELDELFKTLVGDIRSPRTIRFEMTLFRPPKTVAMAAQQVFGHYLTTYSTYLVPLGKGFSWIWDTGYENDVRRCVRKARKSGVTVDQESTPEGAELLHHLHGLQMSDWGEKPHTAEALWGVTRALGSNARIWVARLNGEPVCATLVLYYNNLEVYPWVSGATDKARGVRAYHCMMNDAMEEACSRGFQVWNWGGSVGRSSVEKFKRDMAGEEETVMRVFYETWWLRRIKSVLGPRR